MPASRCATAAARLVQLRPRHRLSGDGQCGRVVAERAVQRRQQRAHGCPTRDENLAVEIGLLGTSEGGVDLLERVHGVDHWMQIGCLHEAQQLFGLDPAGAADTDDRDLPVEDPRQIGARVGAGRGARRRRSSRRAGRCAGCGSRSPRRPSRSRGRPASTAAHRFDCLVCAELQRPSALLDRPAGDDDPQPGGAGQRSGGRGHAPAGPLDQHRLARLGMAASEQHADTRWSMPR